MKNLGKKNAVLGRRGGDEGVDDRDFRCLNFAAEFLGIEFSGFFVVAELGKNEAELLAEIRGFLGEDSIVELLAVSRGVVRLVVGPRDGDDDGAEFEKFLFGERGRAAAGDREIGELVDRGEILLGEEGKLADVGRNVEGNSGGILRCEPCDREKMEFISAELVNFAGEFEDFAIEKFGPEGATHHEHQRFFGDFWEIVGEKFLEEIGGFPEFVAENLADGLGAEDAGEAGKLVASSAGGQAICEAGTEIGIVDGDRNFEEKCGDRDGEGDESAFGEQRLDAVAAEFAGRAENRVQKSENFAQVASERGKCFFAASFGGGEGDEFELKFAGKIRCSSLVADVLLEISVGDESQNALGDWFWGGKIGGFEKFDEVFDGDDVAAGRAAGEGDAGTLSHRQCEKNV